MTQTMHNAIPLMDKGKTGYPRPWGAGFGLVNQNEMHLHRLLGKSLRFQVNLTIGARTGQATPNAKASDVSGEVNGAPQRRIRHQ
jgi:hypothetical protein